MKKRIVTSVLVGSLVFTPLAGVSTVWADGIDTSSSESQTTEYCEQFEPLMRSMEPSIALIRAAKCERESQ